MSTLPDRSPADCRILLVGTGGVGAPAAIALAEAGVGTLVLADEDTIEIENLHRQILFDDGDIGTSKIGAAKRSLEKRRRGLSVEVYSGRARPSSAAELVRGVHAVVDATDNFPSRFLLADACHLAKIPVVHAAAIRWIGTALCTAPGGAPCYRCLFEDLPDVAPDCATAGILGPVCGVIGGIAAEMALSSAMQKSRLCGTIATFDGLKDQLRLLAVPKRFDCPLCGRQPSIHDLSETRYVGASSAA